MILNRLSLSLAIAFIFSTASAQTLLTPGKIDSLENLLSNTSKPMERFNLQNRILLEAVGWKGVNIDSATSVELVAIAQELKQDSLLAIAYNWLGTYFNMIKADYPSALEYYFKAIPLAKKVGDKRRISSLYFDIALVYFDLEEYSSALKNTLEGGKNLPPKNHPLYEFMLLQYLGNMSQYFTLTEEPDSAIYYAETLTTAYKNSTSLNTPFYEYNSAVYLGASYAVAGENQKALEYFELVDKNKGAISQSWFITNYYNFYIPLLIDINDNKKALRLAEEMLSLGNEIGNQYMILGATGYLRELYDMDNKIDSAYYYAQKEAETSAFMFSQQNKNKLQSMAFNQEMRSLEDKNKEAAYRNQLKQYGLLSGLAMLFIVAALLYRNNKQQNRINIKLEESIINLKATQKQLIQSEKMASLGELTAGIAHEIQNPLNFVNNFSDLSEELLDELEEEVESGNTKVVKEITKDLKDNLNKIHNHGERASSIVKGMLQHSRTGSGEKEATDINAMADEYLRLAYHGLRAKDKSFNADFKLELDDTLPKIKIVPQDIGRVLLNLINNAFHACAEHGRSADSGYKPLVTVTTEALPQKKGVKISVSDNGPGIPDDIKDKIFQPFFTTKATGEGTGLGLSMSYDIITKGHGGKLEVESKKNQGSIFIVTLA